MLKLVFWWLLPTRPKISGIRPLLCTPLFISDPHHLWLGCLHCLPGQGDSNNSHPVYPQPLRDDLGTHLLLEDVLTPDCPCIRLAAKVLSGRSCLSDHSPACKAPRAPMAWRPRVNSHGLCSATADNQVFPKQPVTFRASISLLI